MTGVLMARKGLAKPVGSMTQYDKMRVGRGEKTQRTPNLPVAGFTFIFSILISLLNCIS